MYPVFSCIYWVIFADLEGIEQQSLEGARMGFTGKQVIHPSHVPIVQRAFSPTQEQVTWASQLVEAFTAHSQSGKVREREGESERERAGGRLHCPLTVRQGERERRRE